MGSDVLIFSGAGRLDTITVFPPFASGLNLAIIFYDSGVPVSGGPIAASGHKVIGYTPAMVALVSGNAPISGNNAVAGITDLQIGVPRQVGIAFQSGLCVNSRSGQCGMSVSYTPETANQ